MEILIIALLIVLNGVFSMSEIAMVSARKSRLETDLKQGSKSAKAALDLAEEPNRFLSTIQIGITLIGILTGLYSGEAFAHDLAGVIARWPVLAPYSLGIATTLIVLAVTYLTIVFGELVPKRLGLAQAERISKAVARPMRALSVVMTPVVWLLSKSTALVLKASGVKDDEEKVTEEEIRTLIKEGLEAGEVQEVEHDIVGRVFSLGDRDVASIMTHRSEFVWLETSDGIADIRKKVMEGMHDIYPVRTGRHGDLLGVVYLQELFGRIDEEGFALSALVRPARFVLENKSVYGALESFQRSNAKYSFVVDEFGEVQGIVTLTDMMDALVGEVLDQGEQSDIIALDDGKLLVSGRCSFYTFLEYFDREDLYAGNDHNTLGGLILNELEHIPREGEKLLWHGFTMEVADMDGARIDKVLVGYRPVTN